jgi:2-oxoglutarate ferredoxin oxidoreductase subunit gamma
MRQGIVFAGFGGQGIILSGLILCHAAIREGRQVSHIPSYGAEMRGGTANCAVVVADSPIGSPLVPRPDVCVVMNKPSLAKYEPLLAVGGLLLWNSSLIDEPPSRADIRSVAVPANQIAEQEGSSRAANMVVLGALAALKPELASLEALVYGLGEAVSARNKKLNEINIASLRKGYGLVQGAQGK